MGSDGKRTRGSNGVEIKGVGKVMRKKGSGNERKCEVGNYGKGSVVWGSEKR